MHQRDREREILALAREIVADRRVSYEAATKLARAIYRDLANAAADYDDLAEAARMRALATQRPPTI